MAWRLSACRSDPLRKTAWVSSHAPLHLQPSHLKLHSKADLRLHLVGGGTATLRHAEAEVVRKPSPRTREHACLMRRLVRLHLTQGAQSNIAVEGIRSDDQADVARVVLNRFALPVTAKRTVVDCGAVDISFNAAALAKHQVNLPARCTRRDVFQADVRAVGRHVFDGAVRAADNGRNDASEARHTLAKAVELKGSASGGHRKVERSVLALAPTGGGDGCVSGIPNPEGDAAGRLSLLGADDDTIDGGAGKGRLATGESLVFGWGLGGEAGGSKLAQGGEEVELLGVLALNGVARGRGEVGRVVGCRAREEEPGGRG